MVIVITGATSGIGEKCAELFLKEGHTVYSLARRTKDNKGINYIECDLSNRESIETAVREITSKENRIDILINNAGMGISGAFEYHEDEEIKQLIDVNLLGLLRVTKLLIPYLRESKGTIINISSVAGIISIPFQGMYSLSKSAVISFTESLRNELRPFNVKVSAVLPGDTKTGFTEARRKSKDNNEYGNRINRSVEKMEKDERNGADPTKVAKVILKVSKKKNPNTYYIVGFSYKLLAFLQRILPKRLVNYIVYKIYAK